MEFNNAESRQQWEHVELNRACSQFERYLAKIRNKNGPLLLEVHNAWFQFSWNRNITHEQLLEAAAKYDAMENEEMFRLIRASRVSPVRKEMLVEELNHHVTFVATFSQVDRKIRLPYADVVNYMREQDIHDFAMAAHLMRLERKKEIQEEKERVIQRRALREEMKIHKEIILEQRKKAKLLAQEKKAQDKAQKMARLHAVLTRAE